MSINLSLPKSVELKPRIVVIGVGGAGGNAVNNMIAAGLDGVEFVVANTDAQALSLSKADRRIQMGAAITQGLGAGMLPEVGEESAEDSMGEILDQLDGAHMLFIAAGMGGGTGTGAAPVIARAARERGILTVAIVTKPFQFEGTNRMRLAEDGIMRLHPNVDTLITIPNQNLFRIATEATTMTHAFGLADEVLHSGVRSVTDLMVVPGIINLDFSDVRTVMSEMGKAMMGTGEATGERRALDAAESAISNPLLDDVSLMGAKGVLINITGGKDLTLYEVEEAASLIRGQVDPQANIIVGTALDDALEGIVRVSVVATGVESIEGVSDNRFAASSPDMTQKPDNFLAPRERAERRDAEFEMADIDAPAAISKPDPILTQPINVEVAEITPAAAPIPTPSPVSPSVAAPIAAQAAHKPAPAPQTQPQTQPQAAYVPEPVKESPTILKSPFSLWGRKKSVPVAKAASPQTKPQNDLFEAEVETELDIPSFLRRQNR